MNRLLGCLLLALTSVVSAEELLDRRVDPALLEVYRPALFEDDGFQLPYRLLRPEGASEADPRPLLVYLHGYGAGGSNNQTQLVVSAALFASEGFQKGRRPFVLMPQCPSRSIAGKDQPHTWPTLSSTQGEWEIADLDAGYSQPLLAVRRLVDRLIASQPIDSSRLYVTGVSMGGYGSWELAAREPEFWAAAVPICGKGKPEWGAQLAKLPIWSFHGDADDDEFVHHERRLIAAIRAAGGKPIYTEFAGVGHNAWPPTAANQHVWDWLFAQRR